MKQVFLVTLVLKFFDCSVQKRVICCYNSFDDAVQKSSELNKVVRGSRGDVLYISYGVVEPINLF